MEINADVNNHSSTASDFGVRQTSVDVKSNRSAAEMLKLFRKRCGIIDDLPIPVMSKDLSLKQELCRFEEFDKKDATFASFWQRYGSSLPNLGKMAFRYGAIPGTSVPSESVFSIAGYVARKTRSSLTAKKLEVFDFP